MEPIIVRQQDGETSDAFAIRAMQTLIASERQIMEVARRNGRLVATVYPEADRTVVAWARQRGLIQHD